MRSDKSQGDKRFSKSRVFRIFYFFISTFNFKDVYFCLDLKFLNTINNVLIIIVKLTMQIKFVLTTRYRNI